MFCKADWHSKRAITAVIFDVDGTLLDSDQVIVKAMQFAFNENKLPKPPASLIMKFAGNTAGNWVAAVVTTMHLNCTPEQLEKLINRTIAGISGAFFTAYGKVMPTALQTMSALHNAGVKLGVTSNSPKKHALTRLYSLGLLVYFDQVLTAEDMKEPKPSPSSLKKLLAKLHAKPGNSLYVGDSAIDAEYARNCGIRLALLSCNRNKKLAADFKLEKLFDLVEIVKNSHANC